MRVTRRGIQVVLGLLWLLDGALQLQPYMFGPGFASQIIAPTGQGQPGFVAAGVGWSAGLIAAHPALWDGLFAAGQLALGIGLLLRPAVRLTLAASIGWAIGVWYFGEGLGELASGHADLLTGAPGAVLLYAVLAAAAWPQPILRGGPGLRGLGQMRSDLPPALWLPIAWAVLWIGTAVLRALPGQNSGSALADEVSGNADGAPAWLAHLDRTLGVDLHGTGRAVVIALIIVEVAVGCAGLIGGVSRAVAAWSGIVVSVAFWVVGQSFGELYSGHATDPDVAPLVVLLAVALLGSGRRTQAATAGEQPDTAVLRHRAA